MQKILINLLTLAFILILTNNVFAQINSKVNSEAFNLMRQGNVAGAIEVLSKAIDKKQDLVESLKMRAILFIMIGNTLSAIEDYTSLIEIQPSNGEFYEKRATLRTMAKQDPNEIIKDLDNAITHGRKLENVYNLRASLFRQSGNIEAATKDYQTVIGTNPNSPKGYLGLASIHLSKGDIDKAIETLETFISNFENGGKQLPPVNDKIIADAVVTPTELPKQKSSVDSIVITTQLPTIQGSPNNPTLNGERMMLIKNTALAYNNLASYYLIKKNFDKSLELVERARKISPSDSFTFETKGRIKYELKDYLGAIEEFNVAIKTTPNSTFAYLHRGLAFLVLGKNEEAQKDFDKHLSIFPNQQENLNKQIEKAKLLIAEKQ